MQEQRNFLSASTVKILLGLGGALLMAFQLLAVMLLVNTFLFVESTELQEAVDAMIARGGPTGAADLGG